MSNKAKIILDPTVVKRREPSRDRAKSGLSNSNLMSVALSDRCRVSDMGQVGGYNQFNNIAQFDKISEFGKFQQTRQKLVLGQRFSVSSTNPRRSQINKDALSRALFAPKLLSKRSS